MAEKTCDGCRFNGMKATCKRCLTCSRNYSDKHQEPPKPKPMSHESRMALAQLGAIAGMLVAGPHYIAKDADHKRQKPEAMK